MLREEDSPMKKLRLLDDVNDLILESIDDFWKQVPVDKNKLIIAAEEKISIYIYIVVKAKLVDFYSNIWFIREFITEDVRINSLGNQLSTYESALLYLWDLPKSVLIDKIKSWKLEDKRQWLLQMDSRQSLISHDMWTSIASSVFLDNADPFLEVDVGRNGDILWVEDDPIEFNNNFEVASNYMS